MLSDAATYDFLLMRSWLTALFALTGPYCGSADFSVELLSDNCFGRWGEFSSFSPHRFFLIDLSPQKLNIHSFVLTRIIIV